MAVLHSPESPYAKEAVKWEAHHSQYGPPGRPFVYAEYPKRLYRVERAKTGGDVAIIDRDDATSPLMEQNMRSRGFIALTEAGEWLERQDREIAELAANRAFTEKRMSPEARAEAAAADDAVSTHLAEVPVTPIKKRRGRPAKAVSHGD